MISLSSFFNLSTTTVITKSVLHVVQYSHKNHEYLNYEKVQNNIETDSGVPELSKFESESADPKKSPLFLPKLNFGPSKEIVSLWSFLRIC